MVSLYFLDVSKCSVLNGGIQGGNDSIIRVSLSVSVERAGLIVEF